MLENDVIRIGNKWHFADGTVLPVVSGGDGSTEPPATGAGTPPPATSTSTGFSQEEVTRIAAREKDEGERAATRRLLEAAGVKDADELKAIVEAARKRDEAELSEAQRSAKAAESAVKAAEERERVAAAVAHAANVKLALIDAGVPREQLDVVSRLVDVETGADEKAIKAAVDAAKKALPAAFTAQQIVPPNTDPSGKPPASQGGDDAMKRGLERAKAGGNGDNYAFMQ